MDSDDQQVGWIYTRREALVLAARAGVVLAAGSGVASLAKAFGASQSKQQVQMIASPALTEGPFFVDERLNRSDLVSGATRPSVVDGLPLLLSFKCIVLSGGKTRPLKGACVDVWNADVSGVYSDESAPMNHENTSGQRWLRGYQMTDSDGMVRFTTIVPGWYPGRCPHIHFKVRNFSASHQVTAEFTSQVFFREADQNRIYAAEPYRSHTNRQTTNESDGVFNERLSDGSMAGSHMLLDLAKHPSGKGHAAQFSILLT